MKKTVLALMMNAEPLLRLRLPRLLGVDGAEVLWTTALREAVTTGQHRPVDLLLVDFGRPLRSAWEDFECLVASNPEVPVVLLTDRKSEFEQRVGERVGAVLEKPFGYAVLVQTIDTLLGQPTHVSPETAGRGPVSKDAA